jgi:membrane-bound lytic murein transglycosylase B
VKLLLPLFSLSLLAACASTASPRVPSSLGPTEFATQKLRAKGVSQSFIELVLQNYKEDQREKVLDLNFLGFLRASKAATGEERIPDWELERVQKFIHSNRHIFQEAEDKFNVPKEVIASLLWVETKHGRDLGTFPVASALFSMAQADYPTLLHQLLDGAKKRAADYDKVLEERISNRARRKSDWAAGELAALEEIHNKGWKKVENLNGSFSGAFGMAQFVPSSYLTWAKSKKERPNLFKADDSILSVANYLRSNGWESKKANQKAALFHYNRDDAYVNHILRMSDCLKKPRPPKPKKPKRGTASAPPC